MKKSLGWHFSRADCTLGYDDNRKIAAGESLTVDCPLVMCESGLHASKRITDALKYAPGPYIWRVELRGIADNLEDKMVGNERHALWGFDADELLRRYARRCALGVIHLWDAPDVVVRYLKTGDENIRTASRDAARAAAWVAAEAGAAAEAWVAAWERAAAGAAQNKRLTSMVCAEAKKRGLL